MQLQVGLGQGGDVTGTRCGCYSWVVKLDKYFSPQMGRKHMVEE